jgi:hypothetical protein
MSEFYFIDFMRFAVALFVASSIYGIYAGMFAA